ncbi:MAG: RidA family protein [Bacteroidales bacterium]|nr:RidA family protein [Bacteroidales bacterium]
MNCCKELKGTTIVLLLAFLAGCYTAPAGTGSEEALYDYDVEERIGSLGLELTEPGKPVANYVNAVRAGDLVFMAGKGPRNQQGGFVTGKVGSELTLDQGYEAARLAAVEQLSALKAEIGDLNKVVRIVKVTGMVNADPSFTQHSQVVNGFSDLMVEVFGDRGKHARAAVGMSSLPLGFACEVEMVVQVRD